MIREEDPRFKYLERKIGFFMAFALLGIAVALVLYGVQKDYFTPSYTLRFTADRGTGFSKGMSVKLSGFRIGRVTSISLNEQAMVDINVEVDKKYRTWIRNDSTIKLVKEGLVGDSILDVSVGSLDRPELKDGETVLYVKTKGLDEMAQEIADKVKPVLFEVRDIIGYINNPDGDLKRAIHNIEVLTRNLDGTRDQTDKLLVSLNGSLDRISNKAVAVLDSANHKIDALDISPALTKINSTIDSIDKKIPPLLDKADNTLAELAKLSRETRVLSESAFPKIPGLLSQAEDVLFSTDRLINAMQNSWLFGNSSQPVGGRRFIRGDSHE
ncbi:MAG: MlaD family protein [Desulfuromonadaceae bacterium]|nr:MlaD family protein [Desulfuromonadaceae bacterium]